MRSGWSATSSGGHSGRPRGAALAAGQALDGVPIELLDARELDPAWIDPDFDDSSWVGRHGHQGHPRRSPGGVPAAGGPIRGDAAPRHRHAGRRPGRAADGDASDRPSRAGPARPSRRPAGPAAPGRRRQAGRPAAAHGRPEPGCGDPASGRLRPDRGRPRRAGGRRPERGPAGPVLPGVRGLRRRRRPGRLRAPQQRQLHHPRLRRPLQGGRHQRAAADLPDGAAGSRGGHDPRPRGERVPLPVHRRGGVQLQRPRAGPALPGRDPHHRAELLRRLHRLPDPGAAGLGR